MRLSLSPVQVQTTELRQRLEQKLAQRTEQQLQIKISLEQHLFKEDLIQGLIRWANENDAWVNFNKMGFNFTRAQLPYDIAQPIADKYGPTSLYYEGCKSLD
jgi:ABC-type transporter lipoprotein component MlaA|tara:strand:+ start:6311 stop:6616 length:306 start_codon:yes stop_codon:yes gene_type:complete